MHSLKRISSAALALLFAACAPHSPALHPASGRPVKYRYENSLDLRADNTLDHVLVLGYEDPIVHEATSLTVTAGGAPLTLRNQVDVNGAMYNPSVELSKKGTLLIHWDVIDEGSETVELAADPAGNLKVVKRTQK